MWSRQISYTNINNIHHYFFWPSILERAANKSAEVYEQRDQQLGATILVPEDPTKAIKVLRQLKEIYFINF